MQLSVDGLARRVEEIELPAASRDSVTGRLQAGRRNLTFTPFRQDRDAFIEVALLRDDQLAADDTARMVVPPPRSLRVGLVSPNRRLVRRIMEGLSLQRLDVMTLADYEGIVAEGRGRDWDVLVLDAVAPTTMPDTPSIFLGRTPPTDRVRAYGESEGRWCSRGVATIRSCGTSMSIRSSWPRAGRCREATMRRSCSRKRPARWC